MSFHVPISSAVSWDFTPDEIISKTSEFIKNADLLHDKIESVEDPTVENTVIPMLQFENENDMKINQLTFLKEVSPNDKIREASNKCCEMIQRFSIDTMLRAKLFSKIDQLKKKFTTGSLNKEDYSYEIYHFFEKMHTDFVRSGMTLSEETQLQIKDVRKKLSQLMLDFSTNLAEQTEYLLFTKDELKGMSADTLERYTVVDQAGQQEPLYKVSYQYPDIQPVLEYCVSPETRKRAYIGNQNKVHEQNEPLLLEALKLRKQLAQLLGFDTFADYVLDIRMAKNKENVYALLDDLVLKLQPAGEREVAIMKDLKTQDPDVLDKDNVDYCVWDHPYYNSKLLKDEYQVDNELVSEYFPLDHVLPKMLRTFEQMFSIRFVEESDEKLVSKWSKDIIQLSVWKMDSLEHGPEFMGWFYLDLHPREGKYGHAANFAIGSGYHDLIGPTKRKRHYPVTSLVCNFTKPVESLNKPSLLKHDELTTLFHEFGHGIHHLCASLTSNVTRFNSPSSVEWDFVEAPSQMLEFFTWEPANLLQFSKHYKTGSPIDSKLLENLVRAKHVNSSIFYLRQLHFALFDMKVHTEEKESNGQEVLKLWNDLREDTTHISNGGVYTRGYDSFGHIMSSQYAAGYYCYLWAEVYAADMYHSKFAGVDETTLSVVGKNYRDLVLGKSGVYGVTPSVTEFLGRPSNNKAFLKELGIC